MRTSITTKSALATGCALMAILALPAAATAQDAPTQPAATPTGAETPESDATVTGTDRPTEGEEILVTGSRIKQDPNKSALPLQIITPQICRAKASTAPNS